MKRWIHSSNYIKAEAYNYGPFVIQYEEDGYYIYYSGVRKAGPFEKWIDAQDYADDHEDELM